MVPFGKKYGPRKGKTVLMNVRIETATRYTRTLLTAFFTSALFSSTFLFINRLVRMQQITSMIIDKVAIVVTTAAMTLNETVSIFALQNPLTLSVPRSLKYAVEPKAAASIHDMTMNGIITDHFNFFSPCLMKK